MWLLYMDELRLVARLLAEVAADGRGGLGTRRLVRQGVGGFGFDVRVRVHVRVRLHAGVGVGGQGPPEGREEGVASDAALTLGLGLGVAG